MIAWRLGLGEPFHVPFPSVYGEEDSKIVYVDLILMFRKRGIWLNVTVYVREVKANPSVQKDE